MKPLNALPSFFVVLAVSLAATLGFMPVTHAAAPFTDNFDSYSAGDLVGQGGWVKDGGGISPVVQSSIVKSVPGAFQGQNGATVYRAGSPLSSGAIYFDVYLLSSGGNNKIQLLHSAGGWSDYSEAAVFFERSGATETLDCGGTENLATFSSDEWHTVGIQWAAGSYQCNLDGGAFGSNHSTGYAGILDTVYIHVPGDNYFIDNISDAPAAPPVTTGWDPILEPTAPVPNTTSLVDLSSVSESGKITIPTANTNNYYHLTITYLKKNALLPVAVSVIALGGITGGQHFNYSSAVNIPITVSGNNYFKVQYTVDQNDFGSWPLLTFDDTWVSDNPALTPPPSIIVPSTTQPPAPAMEDCGAYSGIDAIMCNFKNFIVGAFLPSNDALNQLSTTMAAFGTKFPMNYAAAISATLSSIAHGIDDNSSFHFTLYGNSGTVSTEIFTKDLGAGVTLGGTIKTILTFLVLMIFFLWGMGYMHRIFAK